MPSPVTCSGLRRRRNAMSTDNLIALVLSIVIVGYLVFALLVPEKL